MDLVQLIQRAIEATEQEIKENQDNPRIGNLQTAYTRLQEAQGAVERYEAPVTKEDA